MAPVLADRGRSELWPRNVSASLRPCRRPAEHFQHLSFAKNQRQGFDLVGPAYVLKLQVSTNFVTQSEIGLLCFPIGIEVTCRMLCAQTGEIKVMLVDAHAVDAGSREELDGTTTTRTRRRATSPDNRIHRAMCTASHWVKLLVAALPFE